MAGPPEKAQRPHSKAQDRVIAQPAKDLPICQAQRMTQQGDSLEPGLYEELVTQGLSEALSNLNDAFVVEQSPLRAPEAADRLALHLAELVERTVAGYVEDDRVAQGISLLRALGERLVELSAREDLRDGLLLTPGGVLREIQRKNPAGDAQRLPQPLTPLLDTTLLTNPRGEPALNKQLLSEIPSALRIDVIMAFIRYSGIRPFLDSLRQHCSDGRPLRVLTTTYTGSTEQRALDELHALGADIRVSYDTSSTRLHAKAWLFSRAGGSSTAYVGSSNLTHSAQVAGLEWNVRLAARRNPGVVTQVEALFASYWESGDFVPYDQAAFAEATDVTVTARQDYLPPFELRPEPFQSRLLERLEVSRNKGFHRNLLVAATGTGKTVMAALDYARLRARLPRARLLFVAHRKEILEQSMRTFRHALREPAFGELWVDGQKPTRFEHVFASIQSLNAAGIAGIDPQHFDVVIIDEFHHAAAASYEALLDHLQPAELLGLTATPERADGMPILHWFGDRIAAELRLWDAIDQQRLAPFHYYGLHDGTDLSAIPWKRGRGYDTTALANLYTSNDAWARSVIQQVDRHVADMRDMRALGFCVSVDHARFMAHHFGEAGINAAAITSETPAEDRASALRALADGSLQAIFSVDLFNEGVDIPAVDTVLMLRPTESATVFLQQLGRGLRKSPTTNKTTCTVLDFVGNQNREFRFDIRYAALLGGTRKDLARNIEAGFPYLPAGCFMELDPRAQEVVLESIRNSLPSTWPAKVAELRTFISAGHPVILRAVLEHSGLDLDDIYDGTHSWSDLLEAAGGRVADAGPDEVTLRRAIGRLRHVDDEERLDAYGGFASQPNAPHVAELEPRSRALIRMLTVSLLDTLMAKGPLKDATLQDAVNHLWRHPQVLAEVGELLSILDERVDHVHAPLEDRPDVPLQVHAQYTRQEILAALHQGPQGRARTPEWREGVRWCEDIHTDLLTITFDKSPDHFSPTTRYRDFAISPNLLHWESQSTTSRTSPTGERYLHHVDRGSTVLVFARVSNQSRAFYCLGSATFVSAEGDRPISITWRLAEALPADLHADFAAVA